MDHSKQLHGVLSSGRSRGKIVPIVFLAIARSYLLAEHRAHAFAVLSDQTLRQTSLICIR